MISNLTRTKHRGCQSRALFLRSMVWLCLLATFVSPVFGADQDDEQAIKKLINDSYVHGAFNELDPEAMRKGFHEDFAIFSPDGEAISKYPIADWVDATAERKADPKFNSADNKWSHEITVLDVTGDAATVKVELTTKEKLVYTDYLSLLRFDSGWRIVAKVYHQHK